MDQATGGGKARVKPAPMVLLIGRWEGEDTFRVLSKLPGGAPDKDIRAALKTLGAGEYVGVLARERKLSYGISTRETFSV